MEWGDAAGGGPPHPRRLCEESRGGRPQQDPEWIGITDFSLFYPEQFIKKCRSQNSLLIML